MMLDIDKYQLFYLKYQLFLKNSIEVKPNCTLIQEAAMQIKNVTIVELRQLLLFSFFKKLNMTAKKRKYSLDQRMKVQYNLFILH